MKVVKQVYLDEDGIHQWLLQLRVAVLLKRLALSGRGKLLNLSDKSLDPIRVRHSGRLSALNEDEPGRDHGGRPLEPWIDDHVVKPLSADSVAPQGGHRGQGKRHQP